MREISYYFGGMLIAFLIITIYAYYALRKQYFIVPTINNIWRVIEVDDGLALYICAVLFYPVALLYATFLVIVFISDNFVKGCLWMFTSDAKIIKGKIAMLKVGDEVRCTRETSLTLDSIRTDRIIAVQDDRIMLEHPNCDSKFIRKKNFLLYNDELIGIAEVNRIE
jgi:hypothetical protein